MYKYLLLTWLIAGLIFTIKAQTPDTASRAILNSKSDTFKAVQRDTGFSKLKKAKVRKEKVYHTDSLHNPHTAVMRSLIVPGWGQAYNRRIWKVPLVYGGLASFAAAIVYNGRNYTQFLALSKYRRYSIVPRPTDPYYIEYNKYLRYQEQAVYDAKDGFRRDRDLCILGFVVFWGVNAVDAYIDAKFIHSYALDNNFAMRVTPGFMNQATYTQNSAISYIPGIKITFTL